MPIRKPSRKAFAATWLSVRCCWCSPAITVAVNQFHLAVPAAITLALIIATIKGSMVASVFMHLSHEKKWIYGALLLTVVFFVVLLFLPLLTVKGGIGTPIGEATGDAQTTEAH